MLYFTLSACAQKSDTFLSPLEGVCMCVRVRAFVCLYVCVRVHVCVCVRPFSGGIKCT